MKIDATTFAKLPEHLQALFIKAPNPVRDEVVAGFPSTGNSTAHSRGKGFGGEAEHVTVRGFTDSGSAARFFYSAKVSKKERNAGLPEGTTNTHPTVKPIALMRYLCRLVTPPGGTVLDPFTGSGSTGVAAIEEGFNFVGCEMTDDYIKIATARLEAAIPGQVHDYSDDDVSDAVGMPVNASSGPSLLFE